LAANGVDEGFENFLGSDELSRDSQIGSIGGGNHFVELQVVDKIHHNQTAAGWGLRKGQIAIMVHSGSVGIGHYAGLIMRDEVRSAYPPQIVHPPNGIFPWPDDDSKRANRLIKVIYNAGNFAFGNRLFLGLMAIEVLRKVCGIKNVELLRDAPHNLFWRRFMLGQIIHRKGACSAVGINEAESCFGGLGEPVLVPGSMGSSSFVLAGRGCGDSFDSASHGAGRMLSRGDALKYDEEAFIETIRHLRIVTPVDFNRPDIRMRRDIAAKKMADIKKEAPFAYKEIGPVIKTLSDAGIAIPVAELRPLMTIKG
jgi:tRNA-splicing ligase RtcB